MLKDNNIKSTATNKIELLFQLFAGILKREDIFPPKKNMLKHII